MIGLRLNGHAIGIDPNDARHAVYANRADVGEWETILLFRHDNNAWGEVVFLRTQRRLTITPDGRLESRALTDPIGEWEQLICSPDGQTVSRAGVTLTVEGALAPPAPVVVVPVIVAPERLHVEGLGFVTESGQPWTMAFITGFRDLERHLHEEDIEPLLVETIALGGNGRRVFGAFDFGSPQVQRLYPFEHLDYYDRLPAFCQMYADHGLWLEFVGFADTARSVPGGKNLQAAHWRRLCDALRDCSNVLLERVNENDQHDNRVDADLPKPDGICSSFGSNGAGNDPPGPFWDYAALHSERRGDFALSTPTVNFSVKGYTGDTAAHSFGGTRRATVVNEPPGIADANVPGRRTADPRICYQMGVGCATWGAGGTAHSECGIQSVLHTDVQAECVRQFLAGVKAVR